MSSLPFHDRHDAGRQLADALDGYKGSASLVLALPRGGVAVGFEVARALSLPLDVMLVHKIGAPDFPELGLGAIIGGDDPQIVLNDEIVGILKPPASYLATEAKREFQEIERRRVLYRGDKPPPQIAGRTVILVDDGVATGGTVRIVLRYLRRAGPARLVLAVPVAPRETIRALQCEADAIVCLRSPEPFQSVGGYYLDFEQTADAEVLSLLQESALALEQPAPPAKPTSA
jgi:putative phosphoribosyl transferase